MNQYKVKDIIHNTLHLKYFVHFFSTKKAEIKRVLYFFCLRYLVFVCVTILIIWGLKKVWYSLTDLTVFKVSPSTFSFQTPPWVTDRFSEYIKNIKTLNERYNMYENDLTQKIAEVYGEIALIKKVDSIKKIFPNTLSITLVLRKPAAVIKSGKNTYLVDDECILLPKEYYLLPNAEYDSPYIRGNRFSKLPLYGNTWDDRGIKAGVNLIKFLKANNIHNIFKILVVDVSNVCKRRSTGKSDIILWTENNTQIRWGCSSFCNEQNELSDEEKLQNLLSVAKSEGTNLRQMEYIDVRWKKPVGKRWAKVDDLREEH